jgi:hypothetical protein
MSAVPSMVKCDRWVAENDAALLRASTCPRRRRPYTAPVPSIAGRRRAEGGARPSRARAPTGAGIGERSRPGRPGCPG